VLAVLLTDVFSRVKLRNLKRRSGHTKAPGEAEVWVVAQDCRDLSGAAGGGARRPPVNEMQAGSHTRAGKGCLDISPSQIEGESG